MKYDIILFENFHAAFHHKYDVFLIARLLKSQGMKVAILNVYGEDNPEDYSGIELLNLPFNYSIPNDRAWLQCKGASLKRLFYTIRFLAQQHRYMRMVRSFIQDKANSFYLGSYHLLMPSTFLSFNKPCYYWGLRSYRMTGFWQTFSNNPFLAIRMACLKSKFLNNQCQALFVSNEIIKKEFISLGVPEERLVIREERCIEVRKKFNPEIKDNIFSLLVIGGLRRQKHVEMTVRAYKEASLENGLLRLIGENHDGDYEKIIEEEMVGCKNIERLNKRLTYEEFNDFMNRSHFILFADEKQQSSVTNGTMLESLINFTPFIGPDYEPYKYYADKYGVGLTYKPGCTESYSETIKKAHKLGYRFFIDKIIKFQETINFDKEAKDLFDALNK